MVKRLKEGASVNWLQVIGAAITALAFSLLFFGSVYAFILAAVLAAGGLSLLSYGYVVAFRFDPNSGDPERRKAISRSKAVWGDRLAEVLRASEIAEATKLPETPAGPVSSGESSPPVE
jgi:hypothetical protein